MESISEDEVKLGTVNQQGEVVTLKKNAIGTAGVVFLVLAGITPLGSITAPIALGIGFGNGAGFPGALLCAGIVLVCFAVGYVAMSRHVTNAGAFYAYVSRGLGRPLGVGTAAVAVVSYMSIVIAVTATVGFFAENTFRDQLGISIPWYVYSLVVVAIVGLLAVRGIDIGAKVLTVVCSYEFLVVMILVVAIIATDGFGAFSFSSFSPSSITSGAPGVAFLWAFALFIGFEATAIYSEESRDPKRTIARATYISLAVILCFYILITWTLVAAYGTSDVQGVAAEDPGNFAFMTAENYVGSWLSSAMQWGVLIAFFASALGLHNSGSRYVFALGRSELLPKRLGHVHPRFKSPWTASIVLTTIELVVIGVAALVGLDPLTQLNAVTGALATFGIVMIQALAAVSVVAFFWKREDRSWLKTVILPSLGALGLIGALYLIIKYFSMLTGYTVGWTVALPYMVIAIGVIGVGYALWLRSARVQRYDNIVRTLESGEPASADD
jgi:amino acid transporter